VQSYIGAPITRQEDARFLTGRATFIDDIKVPDMLHAAILRSPHAHARIRAIDTTLAQALPGVIAILSWQDIAAVAKPIPVRLYPLPGLERYLQYPLAQDTVRHVGEAVAVVIAESRYLAEDGLEAIEVTYEPLPAVTDVREALRDTVLVQEENGTNLAAHYTIDLGDVEQAFRSAEYTRRETFRVHRHTGNPLETRGLVASYDAEKAALTVWGMTKVPHFNRAILSSFLDLPEAQIHFIEPDVGGGFGIRGEFYPEDFLIPFAAIRVGRPVKWIEDRVEHLLAANHSRDVQCEIEVAAKRDGTLLGMRAVVYGRLYPHARGLGPLLHRRPPAWPVPHPGVSRLGPLRDEQQDGGRDLPGPRTLRVLLHPGAPAGHGGARPGARPGGAAPEESAPALGHAVHPGEDTPQRAIDGVRQRQLPPGAATSSG
jgi:carbon-monoxide dehydrogenase large subunit